jgi:uncharacterized protein YbjT (DUF2867 family)
MQQPLPATSARTVLVTGATGRTGRLLVDALRAAGHRVRALVRGSSGIPAGWDDVETAVGDLRDAASLKAAMRGVDTVVLLSPMDPELDALEAAALAAAAGAGVGHVVKISTTLPAEDSPISWWRAHARAERALRASPLRWTVVRPNGIAFFLLDYAASVRAEGVMRTAAPDGGMALIDPADIAAVVAAVVGDPGRFAGATLAISGPAAVSYDDIAATLSRMTGRSVRHVAVSEDDVRAQLLAAGRPEWEVEGVVANFRMTRGNAYGFDRVTTTVRDVLGREPRTVKEFLRPHLHGFVPEA